MSAKDLFKFRETGDQQRQTEEIEDLQWEYARAVAKVIAKLPEEHQQFAYWKARDVDCMVIKALVVEETEVMKSRERERAEIG